MTCISWLLNLPWGGVITAVLGTWTVIIAQTALGTWRKQAKAERQLKFLDDLSECVHKVVLRIRPLDSLITYQKIEIESYATSVDIDRTIPNAEAVAYIKSDGFSASQDIAQILEKSDEQISQIQVLLIKGRSLDFENYHHAVAACENLILQRERYNGIRIMIRRPERNWRNPKIAEQLARMIAINEDEIPSLIRIAHRDFISFVEMNYALIQG